MGLLDRDREDRRETQAGGQPLVSGETVTPGEFECRECGFLHTVGAGRITNLPVCPRCQGERWGPT